MAEIVVHPATQKLLDAYLKAPAHAVCLVGDLGAGLGTLAADLAEKLSGHSQAVMTIAPEKGLISIDRVRNLYEQTRSIQHDKRCIVIDDADAMSNDAQNALLKLLEEPASNVHFILTTHTPTQLLPTILSRVQQIAVMPIDQAASERLLGSYKLDSKIQMQTLFLASGKPAELTRLASDNEYFTSRTVAVTDARSFLQSDTYTRLTIIKKYTDRTNALEFLAMCAKLLNFSLLKQRNYSAADNMELFDKVMRRIEANGHVRTHLMHLVTKLP